jgi:hypothetical protein
LFKKAINVAYIRRMRAGWVLRNDLIFKAESPRARPAARCNGFHIRQCDGERQSAYSGGANDDERANVKPTSTEHWRSP